MNIAAKLRLLLCAEQVSYYFAAPYIILLGLDEKRGLFDASTTMNYRLMGYALLVGIYPLLQILIAPYIGRTLDQKPSKIAVMRKVHLANSFCYLLLGFSALYQSLPLALFALCIPGLSGCAAPIGKSLISSITEPEVRVNEFAKLAFIKGVVKLTAPLLGVVVFQWLVGEVSFVPLFLVSSAMSLSCFIYSFTFSVDAFPMCQSENTKPQATLALFVSIVRKNYALLFVFVFLLTGYSVFVKFTPLMIFHKLDEQPSLINYFSSLVGLAYSLNQFILVRFSKPIERFVSVIFSALCAFTILLSITKSSLFWFAGIFGILFCFSALATCIEARLSLLGIKSNQGTVQGVVYSVENWSYLLAPVFGSLLASANTIYPLYFVTFCAVLGTLFFAFTQFVTDASRREIKL